MRNPFDQYTQPENRLTHALACTLDQDRSLLKPFLIWAGATDIPAVESLQITEQQLPGNPISGRDEERGLPDACIYSDGGWAFMVEAKVQAGSVVDQLRRHLRTAERRGFISTSLLLLAVDKPPTGMLRGAQYRAWRDVYCWFLDRAGNSRWARMFTSYMEDFEAQMIEREYDIRGTITMFNGIRFDEKDPFNYREGKRLIRLLGDELQARRDLHRIGVDPKADRRNAITGSSASYVWDYLLHKASRQSANFTAFPHFTLSLHEDHAQAAITIPDGVRGGFRTRLKELGFEGFVDLVRTVEKRLRKTLRSAEGAQAQLVAMQRHYRSQNSIPEMDGRAEMDLRTVVPGARREAKFQPEWCEAIYRVITRKKANIQLQFVVRFPYTSGPIRTKEATDLFAGAWKGMSPVLDLVIGG